MMITVTSDVAVLLAKSGYTPCPLALHHSECTCTVTLTVLTMLLRLPSSSEDVEGADLSFICSWYSTVCLRFVRQ